MIPDAYDIQHAFDAHAVGRLLDLDALAHAPMQRAILVGNTRAWWPYFLRERDRDAADPIDRLVERDLPDALYAHRAPYLPFQRIAVVAGLGALSPTQLVIHPIYGPWFALRAIVFEAGDAPALPSAPCARACACTSACPEAFARALGASDPFAWVAVRDACSHGRAFRYDETQLRYHYGKSQRDLP